MVSSDDKLDALQDSLINVSFALESIKQRMDSVDEILERRQESLNNIYDFMQKTDVRLTKIEAYSSASGHLWSKMAPFMAVLFGAGLACLSVVLLHVYGGR